MDPMANWRLMTDEGSDGDERAVAALDLLVWLAKDCHKPKVIERGVALTRSEMIERCQHAVLRQLDRAAEVTG